MKDLNLLQVLSFKAFVEKYSLRHALVVCNEKEERLHDGIRIIPWKRFLRDLWEGKIIS
jgi:hypothetical protein